MKYPKRTKAYKQALDKFGEPFEVAFENFRDFDEAIQACEDNYQGHFRNLAEYAEYFLQETGQLAHISESLIPYFDYAAYGRDMEQGGGIWTAESNEEGGIHVFHD